jgi:Sec-independent protein translocase protein TatA
MQIFNIGGLELIFILIIAIVIMGPRDMINTARKIGGWVSKITHSEIWATIMNTSQDIRNLPTKIVREAGLEESIKEIQESTRLLQKEGDKIASDVNKEIQESAKSLDSAGNQIARDINKDINQAATRVQLPAITPPEKAPESALDASSKYQTNDDDNE